MGTKAARLFILIFLVLDWHDEGAERNEGCEPYIINDFGGFYFGGYSG